MYQKGITAVALCLLLVTTAVMAQVSTIAPRKTYYWITPDSSVVEATMDSTVVPTDQPSGWVQITPAALHLMQINTPSENAELARSQGYYWEEETDGTRESRWYIVGQGAGSSKWIQSGAKSERIWTWPGRVYAKTSLYRDGVYGGSTTVNLSMNWVASAQTWRFTWTDGSVHTWLNKTEHWYGSNWIYRTAPDMRW